MGILKKHIAILGSTGSIGTQALDVVRAHHDKFKIDVLSAENNAELLIRQGLEFLPETVVIGNAEYFEKVKSALEPANIKVFCGKDALAEVVQAERIDLVLTASVGYSGLLPTLKAIADGKDIPIANKETLV